MLKVNVVGVGLLVCALSGCLTEGEAQSGALREFQTQKREQPVAFSLSLQQRMPMASELYAAQVSFNEYDMCEDKNFSTGTFSRGTAGSEKLVYCTSTGEFADDEEVILFDEYQLTRAEYKHKYLAKDSIYQGALIAFEWTNKDMDVVSCWGDVTDQNGRSRIPGDEALVIECVNFGTDMLPELFLHVSE